MAALRSCLFGETGRDRDTPFLIVWIDDRADAPISELAGRPVMGERRKMFRLKMQKIVNS
ncbi:MAG: hypothetical protein JSS58_10980 [Proteobacteria bacterium]|nr:hypothetical protein [Pseudomonadota bacterium]